jgi:hypothetical protein
MTHRNDNTTVTHITTRNTRYTIPQEDRRKEKKRKEKEK